ncbi:unnamed protein product, partial [Choristocarpus tenellus]
CVEVVKYILEHGISTFMSKMGEGQDSGEGKPDAKGAALMSRLGVLVVCRFERLLVEEQSVIRCASVAGVEFSICLLQVVMPRNIRAQLELIIQALVTAKFLVYSRHSYYRFRSTMVHTVLYNLTPASSRKKIHKAVADYYMFKHADEPHYLSVITYHLIKAKGDMPRAVEFLCKTAAHALLYSCYEDCAEALEKAVVLVGNAAEIHEVCLRVY